MNEQDDTISDNVAGADETITDEASSLSNQNDDSLIELSPVPEHTSDLPTNQEKVSHAAVSQDQKLVPWVDYVPRPELKRPTSREEAVRMRFDIMNGSLIESEYMILSTISKMNVIRSPRYYWEYQREANEMFRRVAMLRQRKINGKLVDLPKRELEGRELPLEKPKKKTA
jgi:hypothetical protein